MLQIENLYVHALKPLHSRREPQAYEVFFSSYAANLLNCYVCFQTHFYATVLLLWHFYHAAVFILFLIVLNDIDTTSFVSCIKMAALNILK